MEASNKENWKNWLVQNTPWLVEAKNKNATFKLVCPFATSHGFDKVIEVLAERLKDVKPPETES